MTSNFRGGGEGANGDRASLHGHRRPAPSFFRSPRPRWLTIPLPKITVGKQKASEAMTASTERRSSYNFAVKKMWSSTSEVLKLLLGAGSVVRRLPICKPFFPAAGLPCRNQSSRRSSQLIKQVAFDLLESDNRLCVAPRTELQASLQPSPPARSCPCHPQYRRSAIDHRTRPTPAPGGQLQEVWRLGIGIPGDFVGNLGLTTDRAGLAAPGQRPTKLWSIWGLVGRSVVHDHPERWAGSTDCAATQWSVRRRYWASSRQGEISR